MRRLSEAVDRDAALVDAATAPQRAALRTARQALALDEVATSCALAGYRLTRAELVALLERGIAAGGRRLETYDAVADYAGAARYASELEAAGGRRAHPYLRTEEVLELHRHACRRTGIAPGSWRERNVPAVRSGLVPPAHWLVPREVAAFADRFAAGPPARMSPVVWVAGAHARLLRVQPFDGGNGRVARLVANLLLRRLGLPPAAFTGRLATRYRPALAAADGGDIGALAELTGEAVAASFTRLVAALGRSDDLRPLRELVPAGELAALVKAAQRGRLRVLRRGARVLSTPAWIAEYRAP